MVFADGFIHQLSFCVINSGGIVLLIKTTLQLMQLTSDVNQIAQPLFNTVAIQRFNPKICRLQLNNAIHQRLTGFGTEKDNRGLIGDMTMVLELFKQMKAVFIYTHIKSDHDKVIGVLLTKANSVKGIKCTVHTADANFF